jgi:hypothetical protein
VRLLTISPREATLEVRGFHGGSEEARASLERHGISFVRGYNAAIEASAPARLLPQLEGVPQAERGFAYEGAGMACALLDLLSPRKRERLANLLHGPGDAHVYMIHVGAGWALARLRLRPRRRLPALDPFLRWLALDGYGFHEGFFHTRRTVFQHAVPGRLYGYERRAFDQGLGRALWFVRGGDVDQAARTLERFPRDRRSDLWSGLALATAYTGTPGVDLGRLRTLGIEHARAVTQGAAFAVAARHRAGNVIVETHRAADVLCNASVEQVVDAVRAARHGLAPDAHGQSYERWRASVGRRLLGHPGSVAA